MSCFDESLGWVSLLESLVRAVILLKRMRRLSTPETEGQDDEENRRDDTEGWPR